MAAARSEARAAEATWRDDVLSSWEARQEQIISRQALITASLIEQINLNDERRDAQAKAAHDKLVYVARDMDDADESEPSTAADWALLAVALVVLCALVAHTIAAWWPHV